MARLTHYDILGARRSDPPEALRDAYRRAQKRYHPDHARDDADRSRREAAARLINESYALLRDPLMRAKYDAALLRSLPPWARIDPGALLRGRGTWLLRIPLPDAPRMPRTERLAAVLHEIWATRIGQWSLLLLGVAAVWITARDAAFLPIALAVATAAFGALLARGGPPTPATDAEGVLAALGRLLGSVVIWLAAHGRGAGQRVAAMRAEYESRDPE